jgi:hypothetical protein
VNELMKVNNTLLKVQEAISKDPERSHKATVIYCMINISQSLVRKYIRKGRQSLQKIR